MIEDYKILQIVPITDNKIYIVKELNKEKILKDDYRYGFDFEANRIYGMALIESNAYASDKIYKPYTSIEPIITQGFFDIPTNYGDIISFDVLLNEPHFRGKVYFDDISKEKYKKLLRKGQTTEEFIKAYNRYEDVFNDDKSSDTVNPLFAELFDEWRKGEEKNG